MLVDQYGKPIEPRAMVAAKSHARKRAGQLRAAYDAAIDTDENRKHWRFADNLSSASANSIEVRRKLRSRARYECLEANSFAKGICLTLSNDTISIGPSLQVNTANDTVRNFIEGQWKKWAKAVRLGAKLRTAKLSQTIDGEVFLLKTTNRRLSTPVQLDIRLVEADQISTPGFVDGLSPDQVDGIVFEDGYPVTYHMLKGHPGDRWPQRAWEKDDIDASDIIHMFRSERPGQARGIPEVTPALPLFAMLRRYTLATILAAEIAADFAAILKTAASQFDEEDDSELVDAFDSVQIDRGMMTALPRGYEMQQFKAEQPTTTYENFRNAILQEIARCVHMPANKARADSSSYNFSSGRLDHQTYYEAVAIDRSNWEIECLDRIFEWWLDEALMIPGYLDSIIEAQSDDEFLLDNLTQAWRWPPHRDVDPAELADVNVTLIQAGLKSRRQYWVEQNMDPDHVQDEITRERSQLAAISGQLAAGGPGGTPATGRAENNAMDTAEAPTSEFSGMKRSQLKNSVKAIDDALDNYGSGTWSKSRTKIFLQSVGLKDQSIDALLEEVEVVEV